MDWADNLISKKIARGNNSVTAEELRDKVNFFVESNTNRENDNWTPEKLAEERKKEQKRQIAILMKEDAQEQFKYDYAQKGIIIQSAHSEVKIESVQLPFTPEEWADLFNKEGEYLGACCADISRIRDILIKAAREDGYIEVGEFFEAVSLSKGHHNFPEHEPIGRMIALWDKIKDDVKERPLGDPTTNLDTPQGALKALAAAADTITWGNFGGDRGFSHKAEYNYSLATIMVAVRVLNEKLHEMDTGDIEGFGIFKENGEIAYSNRGLAIFETMKQCQEIVNMWNKMEKASKRKKLAYLIKKVKVGMKNGLEII